MLEKKYFKKPRKNNEANFQNAVVAYLERQYGCILDNAIVSGCLQLKIDVEVGNREFWQIQSNPNEATYNNAKLKTHIIKGNPDLMLLHKSGRFIFIELKAGSKLSTEQAFILDQCNKNLIPAFKLEQTASWQDELKSKIDGYIKLFSECVCQKK